MLINIYYIRDSIVRLGTLKSNIQRTLDRAEKSKKPISKEDIGAFKSNFYGIAIDMLNALSECIFAFDSSIRTYSLFISSKSQLQEAIKQVRSTDDLQVIQSQIDTILQPYEEFNFNEYTLYYYKSDYRYAYTYSNDCTIEEFYLQMIARQIKTPKDREIKILDPQPRRGENIKGLKALLPNAKTYAAAVPEREASYVKSNFDRVALGTLKGSTISNDAFDILLLQPAVSLEKQSERIMIKKEKDMIRDTIKYLRPGGYLILLLPYFRFYKDICLILAKHYTDIQVRKFSGAGFEKTGAIFLVAKRKSKDDKEIDPKEYQKIRHLYNIDEIKNIVEENFEELMLPEEEEEIKLFRGSILDIDEIKNIFENSGCMNQFWKDQSVEKMSESKKNPLLPFNTGQLGLVLTSGVLDGIIDEGNGHYHIVKGRVVKKTDSERDLNSNEIELTETTSNRVEINVLLPDGTHKILA